MHLYFNISEVAASAPSASLNPEDPKLEPYNRVGSLNQGKLNLLYSVAKPIIFE